MQRPTQSDNHAARMRLAAEAVADLRRTAAGADVVPDAELSAWTSFRIGGPAAGLCPVHTPDDARRFLDFASERDLPFVCLGGGSNVLADDGGFPGLVLHMCGTHLELGSGGVVVDAGLGFDALVEQALDAGRPGLAFASGIPGTVGGAVVGNAGCYGHEIGEFVVEALVLDIEGRLERLGPEDLAFAYRDSALKGGRSLLLRTVLDLPRGDRNEDLRDALAERAAHLADRERKHPVDEPSAGSFFRNLPPAAPGGRRRAAGALLDALGAREWREGDAAVFHKHANIIVNLGRARCNDVLRLAERMRRAVREAHGVELRREVLHLAADGFASEDSPAPPGPIRG